eukprot:2564923-Amphidinium_carterae.1
MSRIKTASEDAGSAGHNRTVLHHSTHRTVIVANVRKTTKSNTRLEAVRHKQRNQMKQKIEC